MTIESVPYGTAYLYCSSCRTTTKVNWSGKLVMRRCWRCDTILEERSEPDGS